ncbi:Aste57867_13747 [Aphanomyces stellatus]|uniref:Aste57867_13747 protein n=1 Tax=Aphanomyces stellatus TaxID=120398 RepID=A0A485L130_9STRA|nr:hypothetical protein As57867_013697 [Aphanomyces stellatus]VFT90580.1 Aste57867_13747 [Aphanomyces stellatus]
MNTLFARTLRNTARPLNKSFATIGATLEKAVDTLPHREAVRAFANVDRDDDLRWSYAEFNSYVDELTNGFLDLQFKKGDTIALWLPNNAENLVAQYAAAKAGLTIAAVDPAITSAEELEFVVKDSKAVALLFDPKANTSDPTAVADQVFHGQGLKGSLHTVITTAIDPYPNFLQFRHILCNALEPHHIQRRTKEINDSTPLVVPYAANNGQAPKRGAVLTHGDVFKKAQEIASSVKLNSDDKIVMTNLPAGFVVGSVAAALKNSTVVLASPDLLDHATKLESPSVAATEKADFKRL